MVLSFNCYRLYMNDPNLYEKISLCRFFHKVSTATSIEVKQETI